jgi:hypothetical protein
MTMGHCKHQWQDRSDVLRAVFREDADRGQNDFYVCGRCLRIDEVKPAAPPAAATDPFAPLPDGIAA